MHASLCDFLSDIAQNAIESSASLVEVAIIENDQAVAFSVKDNGKGMSEEVRQKVTDPFYTDGIKHKKRTVGLGIPFLIQAVEAVEGEFTLDSQEGKGTLVTFKFPLHHIDCPPVGNIPLTILSMLSFSGAYEMVVSRQLQLPKASDGYTVVRSEMEAILGDFSSSGTLQLLRTYLQSQEAALDDLRTGSVWRPG